MSERMRVSAKMGRGHHECPPVFPSLRPSHAHTVWRARPSPQSVPSKSSRRLSMSSRTEIATSRMTTASKTGSGSRTHAKWSSCGPRRRCTTSNGTWCRMSVPSFSFQCCSTVAEKLTFCSHMVEFDVFMRTLASCLVVMVAVMYSYIVIEPSDIPCSVTLHVLHFPIADSMRRVFLALRLCCYGNTSW